MILSGCPFTSRAIVKRILSIPEYLSETLPHSLSADIRFMRVHEEGSSPLQLECLGRDWNAGETERMEAGRSPPSNYLSTMLTYVAEVGPKLLFKNIQSSQASVEQ